MNPVSTPEATAAPNDDSVLMVRVQAGDERAFAELMQRWELPVKAVIARIVLNTSEAEDLSQDTFVRLWRYRANYTPERPFKPWILGIAVNLARNRLRWWKRRPTVALEEWTEMPGDSDIPAESGAAGMEKMERSDAVRIAIAALAPEFRDALVLFEYEGMSYGEIAQALNTSTKSVENRILRARARLREPLKGWL